MKYYSSNRIILIENEKGGWYEKAIFFLNKDIHNEHRPMEIVQEAEKIIEDYLKNNGYLSKIKTKTKRKASYRRYKKGHTNRIINICLLLSIILFVYYLIQLFI